MSRVLKYVVSIDLSFLMICTVFYSLGLFIDFGKEITSFAVLFSVFLILLMIIAWIATAVLNKVFHLHNQPIFCNKELSFWRAVVVVFFFVFTICFGVRSEIVDQWERGSEMYMNSMTPVLIPLISGLILEYVSAIGSDK